MNNIQTILNSTKRSGGCSMNPITGAIPTTGFMVGSNKEFERKLPRINYGDIKAYADDFAQQFKAPKGNVFLGTWDNTRGLTYLDVSVNYLSKAGALRKARAIGELEIYDVKNEICIPVTA